MFAILLGVLLCVGYSLAGDGICSNGNETTITFTPYNDGVVGRYLVEWCINVDPKTPSPNSWEVILTYFDRDYYCKHPPKNSIISPGKAHSLFQQPIEIDRNCSYVCLNATLDLVFNACYLLKSSFLVNKLKRNITEQIFKIENNYTEELFQNNTAMTTVLHHDSENVTIVWHTGVPFHYYELGLWPKYNGEYGKEKVDVTPECFDPSQTELICHIRLEPGEYHSEMNLQAPWIHGVFRDQQFVTYDFTVAPPVIPTVESASAWPWALGALVTVVLLGVATRYACRSREARALHKQVLREWLVQRNEASPVPAPVKPPQRHILMLYAREGAIPAKFTAALRDMLQEAPDTQVYDIFSPEVMSMAASGPHAWIRGMLQRNDVSVLLLQTPALAALYQQQLQDCDNAVKLQEPLLGRRVLLRAPQYGDSLLQYAVLLTAEAAHARGNYHKYYIATLTELPTEMFPQLVPYRRYLLPGGAPLLASDLCDVTPSQQSLNTLSTAAREFADLARDNPDYLMDELMLIS